MRTLFLILPVFLLIGCAASIRGEAPPPPPSLLVPCGDPVTLPARALSDQEIEVYWGRDRAGYRACGSAKAGLAEWAVSHHGEPAAK